MKVDILFSVVIPTYNRADKIKRTIDSVLQQSYRIFEIIVIDDGSTDNTEEVVLAINDKRIQYHKIVNSERAVARNTGMQLAKGQYITLLDSDDIYYSNYLFEAAISLFKYNNPPFFHLGYEVKDELNGTSKKINRLKNDDFFILIKGNPLSCMGIFIAKKITDTFKFNENRMLSGSEDWEFWLRLTANFGIKTNNKVCAALLQHDDRSVLSYDHFKLYKRKELAISNAFKDDKVKEVYGKYMNQIDSYADTYIALHLAMSKNKKYAFKYLLSGMRKYPLSFFSRRTLSIFRELIIR